MDLRVACADPPTRGPGDGVEALQHAGRLAGLTPMTFASAATTGGSGAPGVGAAAAFLARCCVQAPPGRVELELGPGLGPAAGAASAAATVPPLNSATTTAAIAILVP